MMRILKLPMFVLLLASMYNSVAALPSINNSLMPVKYFVGRDFEVHEIEKRFFNSGKHITTLVGIGGVGKTQIIRKFIKKNLHKYDIIWEINCSSNIYREISELAQQLNEKLNAGINVTSPNTDIIKDVWRFLDTKKPKYLLVFDNLSTAQNQQLDGILHKNIRGNILIGTRDQDKAVGVLRINMLSQENSMGLIKSLSANKNLSAANLYKQTSGHPLSIYKYITFSNANSYLDPHEIDELFFQEHVAYDLNKYVNEIIHKHLSNSDLLALIRIALINNSDISKENFMSLCSQEHNAKGLYTLIRFGLLEEKINYKYQTIGFSMHDILKVQVLSLAPRALIKEGANGLIRNMNGLFSNFNYVVTCDVLRKQRNILQHCEELLKTIDLNVSELDKQVEFRCNLIMLYLYYTEYALAGSQLEWIDKHIRELDSDLIRPRDENLLNLVAGFHMLAGIYNDFSNADNEAAKNEFLKAIAILNTLKKPDSSIEYGTMTQLAQTLLYAGDIKGAKHYMEKTQKLLSKLGTAREKLDITIWHFLNAKIFLEDGEYNLALSSIEQDINLESSVHTAHALSPSYSLKADILERMGKPHQGIKFAEKAYDIVKKSLKRDTELLARTLISLARCEKSLRQLKSARQHINTAKDVLQHERKYPSIEGSNDDDLADLLYIEGELNYLEGHSDKAIRLLILADTVYSNRFKSNLQSDKIKKLYRCIMNVATSLGDKFTTKMYSKKLEMIEP